MASSSSSDQSLWHRRLGHLNRLGMKLFSKIYGINVSFDGDEKSDPCESCVKGQMVARPFP